MRNILLIVIIFFTSIQLRGQSAWTLEENHWYAQLAFTSIGPYDEIFVNGNETAITSREISDKTLQFYVEYGLDNKTTLQFNLPIKFIETGNQTTLTQPTIISERITALGNTGFGIRRNFYDKGFVVSGSAVVEANTSRYYDLSGIRTGSDAWTFTPSISIGKGTNDFFLQGNIGVSFRTNNYSHFFRLNGEVGYKFVDWLWTIFYVDLRESFNNGTIALPENNLDTSLYVNNQEFIGYGLKVITELTKDVGFTAAFGGALSANAEARKAALNLGLYFKLGTKKSK